MARARVVKLRSLRLYDGTQNGVRSDVPFEFSSTPTGHLAVCRLGSCNLAWIALALRASLGPKGYPRTRAVGRSDCGDTPAPAAYAAPAEPTRIAAGADGRLRGRRRSNRGPAAVPRDALRADGRRTGILASAAPGRARQVCHLLQGAPSRSRGRPRSSCGFKQ